MCEFENVIYHHGSALAIRLIRPQSTKFDVLIEEYVIVCPEAPHVN